MPALVVDNITFPVSVGFGSVMVMGDGRIVALSARSALTVFDRATILRLALPQSFTPDGGAGIVGNFVVVVVVVGLFD